MKKYIYLVSLCILTLFCAAHLYSQNENIIDPKQPLSITLAQPTLQAGAKLTLPLSLFVQQVTLRKELRALLAYMASNPSSTPLDKQLQEYLNQATAIEALVDAYLFFVALKTIMHCQRSHPVPARLPLSSYPSSSSNPKAAAENLIADEMEQKISISELVELFERVQEDLKLIKKLDRSDKKEILNILLARQQYLERKLKDFGILHYSSQSSFWKSSLPSVLSGIFLTMTVAALCIASVDPDDTQLNLQLPSRALLVKNLKRMRNQQPPQEPVQQV